MAWVHGLLSAWTLDQIDEALARMSESDSFIRKNQEFQEVTTSGRNGIDLCFASQKDADEFQNELERRGLRVIVRTAVA